MEYLLHILIVVGVYQILSLSLDLVAGEAGIISVAQAGFYGIGAYSFAVLALRTGLPFTVNVILGMAIAVLVSLIVAVPALRTYDDYLVMVTFGFQVVLSNVFNSWVSITNGAIGIVGVPRPVVFGWRIHTELAFLCLTVILVGCATLVKMLLSTSPFGRVLRAIREDELFARSLGKNTHRFKITAFAVSAAVASTAGCLMASYVGYVDPTSFTVLESVLIISMVVVGGAGSTWGPLVGAMTLVVLPELLRFLGLPNSVAANLRQILYGSALVIMMVIRPRGLVGRFGFGR